MGKLHLMESWRDRAKGAMKDKGVSQDTLAEELGLTQGAIQKWLAGTRHPNLDDIDRIAAALNLPGYTLTHGVTAADTITDLPEPALSTMRRLIEAQRRGAATPELWAAVDHVVTLALGRDAKPAQASPPQKLQVLLGATPAVKTSDFAPAPGRKTRKHEPSA